MVVASSTFDRTARKFPPISDRLAAALLASMGCAIATYLAIYQYGGLKQVWEPFFGRGSSLILNSGLLDPLGRAIGFPVHDAVLGAAAYGLEAVLALTAIDGCRRTSRWLKLAYCGLVVLMGFASLLLVVLQPVVFHAWCTLCLASAAISLAIVLLSRGELTGMAQKAIGTEGWSRVGERRPLA